MQLSVIMLSALLIPAAVLGQSKITVDCSKTGPKLSPTQHGIFFEEINHAGDGGIYAQPISNPNFKDGLNHWKPVELNGAKVTLTKVADGVRVKVEGPVGAIGGLRNDGYWGINVTKNVHYTCMLSVNTNKGVSVSLGGQNKYTPFTGLPSSISAGADKAVFAWKSDRDEPKAELLITADAPADFILHSATLQAEKGKQGLAFLRKDLEKKVAEMQPSFVRFPGGCFVEGNKMANAFRWKTTIGDPMKRPGHSNLWGYYSTDGLGYLEYLEWCEAIKAEPLFVINCGMAHDDSIPMDKIDEFVQDALDAIEYANGSADTVWGKRRMADGHPKPFNLQMMEIGNENGGVLYEERYAVFYDAIKKRYPKMKLVANVPVKSRPMDIVDEHYYSNPEFFAGQANRYDTYNRKGPKIYVGEYAVTEKCGKGNLIAGLGEAAFITGMERNADMVVMSSYAPLFVNVDNRAWNPDAIVYDSSRSFGTPSYWVQQMFSSNRGTTVLATELETPAPVATKRSGGFGIGTWNTTAEFKDITVTKDGKTTPLDISALEGAWELKEGAAKQTSLATPTRAISQDLGTGDMIYSLKARKISGAEGFLIMFNVKDKNNFTWWNIGGWGNNHQNIEKTTGNSKTSIASDAPSTVQSNRWYDIRIELKGDQVLCFMDGKRIYNIKGANSRDMFTVSTKDQKTGDILIKVVNMSNEPKPTAINLQKAPKLKTVAEAIVITSQNPTDENSFENPEAVAPKTEQVTGISNNFNYTFPAYSATILRLKSAK